MTTEENKARSAAHIALVQEIEEARGRELDIEEFETWEWAFCLGDGPASTPVVRAVFAAAEVECLLAPATTTGSDYRDQAIDRFNTLKKEIKVR